MKKNDASERGMWADKSHFGHSWAGRRAKSSIQWQVAQGLYTRDLLYCHGKVLRLGMASRTPRAETREVLDPMDPIFVLI